MKRLLFVVLAAACGVEEREIPKCAEICTFEEGVHCEPAGPNEIVCYCQADMPDFDRECKL